MSGEDHHRFVLAPATGDAMGEGTQSVVFGLGNDAGDFLRKEPWEQASSKRRTFSCSSLTPSVMALEKNCRAIWRVFAP